MISLEGSGNIIDVSREEFLRGPRRPRIDQALSRHALAPVLYFPNEVENLARVTMLPTAMKEKLADMDEVVELLVETDIISGILGELRLHEHDIDAWDLTNACDELRELGYDTTDIQEFVIDYTETIDAELHQKAILANGINNARKDTVDIEVFASLRSHA